MQTTIESVLSGEAAWHVEQGDCLAVLRGLPDGCVDAVVTDPPYPEIDRAYGRWTEAEWHALMDGVVAECRRVLTPRGSAVFVLQPNSERVGKMRLWLWEFVATWGREWGLVQDAYWWNHTAMPTVHCHRTQGLMRPSVKWCVWFGAEGCYRNQDAVLWRESDASRAMRLAGNLTNALRTRPSGYTVREDRSRAAAADRGGTTPFNLVPVAGCDSVTSSAAHGHGAGTPLALCSWWVRYLCPAGGLALDRFAGAGTVGVAARRLGRRFLGVEISPAYADIARRRIRDDAPLFASAPEKPVAATLFDADTQEGD